MSLGSNDYLEINYYANNTYFSNLCGVPDISVLKGV